MSIHPVVVELPEDIYERVERTAKGLNQPVQQALIKIVEAGLPSLVKVPPEYQPELEALEAMSDEEPWEIVRSEMAAAQQDRLDHLLQKNQAEGLSEEDALYIQFLETTVTTNIWRKGSRPTMMQKGGWPASRF